MKDTNLSSIIIDATELILNETMSDGLCCLIQDTIYTLADVEKLSMQEVHNTSLLLSVLRGLNYHKIDSIKKTCDYLDLKIIRCLTTLSTQKNQVDLPLVTPRYESVFR